MLKMCRLLAFWVALIFIPVRYDGGLGQLVARFICKYAPAYFPIKVVFEDESAFESKQSYGGWYFYTPALVQLIVTQMSYSLNSVNAEFEKLHSRNCFSSLSE